MDLLNPPRLDKVSVKKSFNRAAKSYDRAAILQKEVLHRLSQRLQYIRCKPERILDIGCGTGRAIDGLNKQYPKARIVCLDMAYAMLQESKTQFSLFSKKRLINADMERLPFADQSFDLLFSNLALSWTNDLPATFAGMARISRPGGMLMFTTFGPGTLSELRNSWHQIDQKPHVHQFVDMHDIGDALIEAGFSQPVVDAETIRLEYDKFNQVLSDLRDIGATNADKNRARGLMTPAKLKVLEEIYREFGFENDKFVASYEVVYGHAWL